MEDNDDRPSERKSENPGGLGFPEDPEQLRQSFGQNVQPDRAEEAADRALRDEPVTREEIGEQSGYKDSASVDVGQAAGTAERDESESETPPRAFPDAKP